MRDRAALRPVQLRLIEEMKTSEGVGVVLGMGGGKTACALTAIADLIGEVDPIKVAEGRYLSDELTIHYGLLPRDQHVMPWRIEDRLKAMGANYVQAGLWRGFAVRDGNLITGQQNFSGEETARLVVEALGR